MAFQMIMNDAHSTDESEHHENEWIDEDTNFGIDENRLPAHAITTLNKLREEAVFLSFPRVRNHRPRMRMTHATTRAPRLPAHAVTTLNKLREEAVFLSFPRVKEQTHDHGFMEGFALWVADKLEVKREVSDDPGCKNSPQMVTALLMNLLLGFIAPGAGFAYMGRWDWFGTAFGIFMAIWLILCCMLVTMGTTVGPILRGVLGPILGLKENEQDDDSDVVEIENVIGAACCAVCGFCLIIGLFIALVAINIWGLVVISSKSLLCGNGCPLQ